MNVRRVRQLIPTKFATAYRTDHDPGLCSVCAEPDHSADWKHSEPSGTPMFCSWWMWAGKCFKVNRTAI
jgi:hypothetical protein